MRATHWNIRDARSNLHSLCTIGGDRVRAAFAGVLMNRSTLAALVVALMLGSGIAGYLIGRPADRSTSSAAHPHGNATDTDAPAARAAPATPAAPRQPPTPAAAPTRPRPAAAAAAPDEPFAYRRFSSTPAAPRPRPASPSTSRWPTSQREIRRLRAHHARGEVGAARGRRQALHRRPGLRPGLPVRLLPGLPRPRRRQARRGAQGRRGAGRASRRRHPARQGLHPAARHAPPACRSPPSTSPSSASRSIA